MKIKKKLNINFFLFKLLNDQKKLFVAAIKYITFQANFSIFFVAFNCVCFLKCARFQHFFISNFLHISTNFL